MFPCPSCSLPETVLHEEEAGEQPTIRLVAGSCLCLALLLAGVAWPPTLLWTPVVSYTIGRPIQRSADHLFTLAGKALEANLRADAGGLFLWPYPVGCPTPGVTRHHALWSADFPQPTGNASPANRDRLANPELRQVRYHPKAITVVPPLS